MLRLILPAAILVLGYLGVDRLAVLQDRLQALERTPRAAPEQVEQLRSSLSELRAALLRIRAHVEDERRDAPLLARMSELEALIGDAESELAAAHSRLAGWERRWEGREPGEVDAFGRRIQELDARLEDRCRELGSVAQATARLAREGSSQIEDLRRRQGELDAEHQREVRDPQSMWCELLGPTVQLAGSSTVGTGVILESLPVAGGEEYVTYVLTAWHVVRDLFTGGDPDEVEVPVKLYERDGAAVTRMAVRVSHDARIDVALLRLLDTGRVGYGARLASRSRLESVEVFDRVYAVGCPLGNDPIPTWGEVASIHHQVDGESYWMISAPTYIGNSGGGIFDAETHELLGIFSKIYTHGSVRSTIVPHMGLVTPLSRIGDWLEEQDIADLEPWAGSEATPQAAALER